jgi:hypothetical protein
MKTIQQQFNDLELMKIFEVLVTDKRTNTEEYIIFEIEIVDGEFHATHEALTTKQEQSNKIAYVSIEIDEDFTLDENLQALYSECYDALITSEFYEPID